MKISEISSKYELSIDTLRYYERIGLIPPVKRDTSGQRDYREEDCRWIEFIKCMRSAGMPIEVLIEYVTLFQQGDSTNKARKALLQEQRDLLAAKIEDLNSTLARLDFKIASYDTSLREAEKRLIT